MDAYPIAPVVTLAGDPPYPIDIAWSTDAGPVSVPFRVPGQEGVWQYWNDDIAISPFTVLAVREDTMQCPSYNLTYTYSGGPGPNDLPWTNQTFSAPPSPWKFQPIESAHFSLHSSQHGYISFDDGTGNGPLFVAREFYESIWKILPCTQITWDELPGGYPRIWGVWFDGSAWRDEYVLAMTVNTSPFNYFWPYYYTGQPNNDVDPALYGTQIACACYSYFARRQNPRLWWHPEVKRTHSSMIPSLTALAFLGSMMLAGGTPAPRPSRK